jgi:hypothetical protein
VADGTRIVNIGRINNGVLSNTSLFVSKPIPVRGATSVGFPFDYVAMEVIESGDSGGPDELPGTDPHQIVAVNSGAGGGTEVLARVDLLRSWILGKVASHGGGGGTTPPPAPDAGAPPRQRLDAAAVLPLRERAPTTPSAPPTRWAPPRAAA